jgi:hypothetical protein
VVETWEEAAMLESIERRQDKRLNHRCTIMLTDDRAGFYYYAQLNNISGDGMYIETEYEFKPGAEFDIRFDTPLFRSAPKNYHAIVKWCKLLVDPGSISAYGVGVKFR